MFFINFVVETLNMGIFGNITANGKGLGEGGDKKDGNSN